MSETKYYNDAIELLKELDQLMRIGKGDGDEAEVIRDKLEDPMEKMSPEEEASWCEYSDKLYKEWDNG
jgi:hypothetical protein